MPDDRPTSDWTEAERQARELAALIDAATDDLERNGSVSPDELRRHLEALEAELAGKIGARRRTIRPANEHAECVLLTSPGSCLAISPGRQLMT